MGASSRAVGVVATAGVVAAAARDYRRAREGFHPHPFWVGWDDDAVFCDGCGAESVMFYVGDPPTAEDVACIEHEDGCAALALERALDEMEKAIRG